MCVCFSHCSTMAWFHLDGILVWGRWCELYLNYFLWFMYVCVFWGRCLCVCVCVILCCGGGCERYFMFFLCFMYVCVFWGRCLCVCVCVCLCVCLILYC